MTFFAAKLHLEKRIASHCIAPCTTPQLANELTKPSSGRHYSLNIVKRRTTSWNVDIPGPKVAVTMIIERRMVSEEQQRSGETGWLIVLTPFKCLLYWLAKANQVTPSVIWKTKFGGHRENQILGQTHHSVPTPQQQQFGLASCFMAFYAINIVKATTYKTQKLGNIENPL